MTRLSILIPLALMLASTVSCAFSYNRAKSELADELSQSITAFASENAEMLTSTDTIAALHQMRASERQPVIRHGADLPHLCEALAGGAYYSLALVDGGASQGMAIDATIKCDSILLVPKDAKAGCAVRLQAYADCSMATVFSVSDQTLPGALLMLSLMSFGLSFAARRRPEEMLASQMAAVCEEAEAEAEAAPEAIIDSIKLTPMQRRLITMLMEAPGRKVGKHDICSALWGDKSNAEESLYTLVRRTKAALAGTGMEIQCNRGESYELHI